MQRRVHFAGTRPHAQPARFTPFAGKGFGLLAAAFEAGTVPCCKRRRLVEKEQFGIKPAPDVAVAPPEIEHAEDPSPRYPAPRRQRLCRSVKAPAAITHEQAARRGDKEFSERVDTVL